MTDTVHRGFSYQLCPTAAQVELFEQFAGVTRLVYNVALEQRRDWWRQHKATTGQAISFVTQSAELTKLRAAFDWIAAVPSACQTYALRDLDAAMKAFYRGTARYPGFRRKGEHDSFRFKGRDVSFRRLNAKWGAVRLPKIGVVKFRLTRDVPSIVRSVNVALCAGQWRVSFACEIERPEARDYVGPAVGIDRGVAQSLTLSTGEFLQAPNLARSDAKLLRARRTLSRRTPRSARHKDQRRVISRLSGSASRARTDWCHRSYTDIARRFGVVAIEALNIRGMTASARGTADAPGRNVRQKAGLNRSILEQCWGKFATFLDYKLTERGGRLISVPAAYTSQTCASCGVVDARSRKSQAVFACVHCDHTDNADVNAAKEILRRSTAWLDVEGRVADPLKRQPGETLTGMPGMLKPPGAET